MFTHPPAQAVSRSTSTIFTHPNSTSGQYCRTRRARRNVSSATSGFSSKSSNRRSFPHARVNRSVSIVRRTLTCEGSLPNIFASSLATYRNAGCGERAKRFGRADTNLSSKGEEALPADFTPYRKQRQMCSVQRQSLDTCSRANSSNPHSRAATCQAKKTQHQMFVNS